MWGTTSLRRLPTSDLRRLVYEAVDCDMPLRRTSCEIMSSSHFRVFQQYRTIADKAGFCPTIARSQLTRTGHSNELFPSSALSRYDSCELGGWDMKRREVIKLIGGSA